MAEQNVPAQPPTRTDEQIVPRSQWLTIGKSNLLFNAQKIQKNPIFQISVDILKNTNFFQALTASANVPAIYLQQFWKDINALAITPVTHAQTHFEFKLFPTGDTVLDFVNELGYPEPVEFVSSIRTNYVHQPWRAILSLLNQCLTGKTSGKEEQRPRHRSFLQNAGRESSLKLMLIQNARANMGKSLLKIQTFFSHTKQATKPSEEPNEESNTSLLHPYETFFAKCKRATSNKACYSQKADKPPAPVQDNPSQLLHRQRNFQAQLPQKSEKGKPDFQTCLTKNDEDQQETIPHEEPVTAHKVRAPDGWSNDQGKPVQSNSPKLHERSGPDPEPKQETRTDQNGARKLTSDPLSDQTPAHG
ncbi:hypothetical protein Tco_1518074 [Tanacetum coccineum]